MKAHPVHIAPCCFSNGAHVPLTRSRRSLVNQDCALRGATVRSVSPSCRTAAAMGGLPEDGQRYTRARSSPRRHRVRMMVNFRPSPLPLCRCVRRPFHDAYSAEQEIETGESPRPPARRRLARAREGDPPRSRDSVSSQPLLADMSSSWVNMVRLCSSL